MKPKTTISSETLKEEAKQRLMRMSVPARRGRRVRVGVDEEVGSEGNVKGQLRSSEVQGRKRLVGCKRNAFLG
jgi:hypothetical protein